MNLEDNIKEAIAKNLPSVAAGELSKFIKEAEDIKVKYESLQQASNQLEKKYEELIAFKSKSIRLDDRESSLNIKENTLLEKERNLDIEKLKHELACANSSKSDIFRLVEVFMKNPRSIEVMTKTNNESIPSRDNYGCLHHDTKITNSFGEIEKKETKD